MNKTIRIATRKSPLAIWQSEFVKSALLAIDPALQIELVELSTKGDKEQTKPLTKIGGKLLFVKELQYAVLNNEADIAVHSIKDLSVNDCPGLSLAAICKREDPRDAFVSAKYNSIEDLPKGAIIGTASPRRIALLKSQRPDINIKVLRGNVGTRLEKCERGEYDGTFLAVAGLKRLELTNYIKEYLSPEIFIPAIGQGAIGVECRESDNTLKHLIQTINHQTTAICVEAERAVNRVLGGDCHTPIAAYATLENENISIRAMVGSEDGKTMLHDVVQGKKNEANKLGKTLGEQLINQGANKLLNKG